MYEQRRNSKIYFKWEKHLSKEEGKKWILLIENLRR